MDGNNKDFVKTLGKRLRAARRTAGLSQRALAEKTGTTAQYVSNLENGRTPPSVRMLVRLASALGVSMDALVGLDNDESPSAKRLKERLPEEWRELVRREVREELRRVQRGGI